MRSFLLSLAAVAFLALPANDALNDRCATTLGSNWTGASGANTDWTVSDQTGACAAITIGTTSTFTGSDYALAYWNADTFDNDQYSQAIISVIGAGGNYGVAVRLSGTTGSQNGYGMAFEGGSGCTLFKWVSGTRSAIGSCTVTWTDGHTLKMSAVGNTITVEDNGTPFGSATDSDIASGKPGLLGYANGVWRVTTWQGGDTTPPAGNFPAAIINAPIRCCELPLWMKKLFHE